MRGWRAAVLAAILASGLATASAIAGPPASIHLGFVDSSVSFDADPALRAQWLDRMSGVRADRVRIAVNWAQVVARAPQTGEDTTDAAWPGYRWGPVDTAVAEATARGLTPIVSLNGAPTWAEGPGRPASAPPGSWRPDPAAFGAFARAAALRYPGVRYWQAWNEPNLNVYLTPQWEHGKPASPAHYRRMLNAFYDAVKAVNPANRVITAGTAPFGDPGTSGNRMRPARFDRELFCVSGGACANPAKFDVLSHHPYSVGGPNRKALNTDDVSVPDLGKLVTPLRRAERAGRVAGAKHHAVWVTEISWDSSPPDPLGVPAQKQARWLEESLYVLWRSGVDTVIWFLARDQAPIPSFGDTYQSGVFLRDGTPKPSATAFAFPFVAEPVAGGKVRLWGRAPAAGRVVVQRRASGRWVGVASFQAAATGRVFTQTVRQRAGTRFRARAGAMTSLTGPSG
jgi:hypothetical protein